MQAQTNQDIIDNQWDAVPIGTAHNNDVYETHRIYFSGWINYQILSQGDKLTH